MLREPLPLRGRGLKLGGKLRVTGVHESALSLGTERQMKLANGFMWPMTAFYVVGLVSYAAGIGIGFALHDHVWWIAIAQCGIFAVMVVYATALFFRVRRK